MKYTRVRSVKAPERGTERSACIDLFVPNDFERTSLQPGFSILIPSGIHFDIPTGFALIVSNRSSVANKNLIVGASIIDEDYTGEAHLHVINVGKDMQWISPGMKLVQVLLIPITIQDIQEVDSVEELYRYKKTSRGSGGFGSTG